MDYTMIILTLGMLALMYFLMIRPENKRKKQAEEMRNSLKKGDKITTIGGIVGVIVHVGADTLVIETGDDRVRLEVTRWAISTTGLQTSEQADNKKKESAEVPEEPSEKA